MKRQYWVLLGLLLVFAAPSITAVIVYQHPQWLLASKTNKGHLLKPPVRISDVPTKKWQIVFWNPESCEKACVAQLDQLARIRLALGRRVYQVAVVLLQNSLSQDVSVATMNALTEADIQVARLSETQAVELDHVLPHAPAIYLASPDGFLVLAYHMKTNPDDVYRDLKRLLNPNE